MAILQDVLQAMDSYTETGDKVCFDLEYVSFDRTRRKGGDLVSLTGVQKVGSTFNQRDRQMINVKVPGSSHHPFPIHIRLITKFNGEKVYW